MASFQILRRSFQQYQWIFANYLFIYSFYFFGYSLTGLFQNLTKTVEGSVEDVIGRWRIQGRGPGGSGWSRGGVRASPLFLDQTETQRGEKIFFGDRPPPRPYLRAWIRYCTRNGLKVVPQTKVKLKVVSTIDDRSDLSDEMANLCAKLPIYEVDEGELDLTYLNQETRVERRPANRK